MKLPLYKCHKTVRAAKIKELRVRQSGIADVFVEGMDSPLVQPSDWVERHQPRVGGYLVQYEGGYESYSPADAFENGYTRIEEPAHV